MLRILFGFTLPLYGFIFFVVIAIIFNMWKYYSNHSENFRQILNKSLSFQKSKDSSLYLLRFLNLFLLLFFYFFFYFFFFLKIYDFNLKMFYINNMLVTQLFIFTLFFSILMYILYNKIVKITAYPLDLGVFIIFIYVINFWLMLSNNLLNIFIILEIFNLLIIYSFIITVHFNYLDSKLIPIKSFWLINICTYQFILNFFSSILFFFFFNIILSNVYSSNFFFLNQFDFNIKNISFYCSSLYISFLIKFGIGPWIFFKIEIYKNFNFLLLLFYTVLYFTCILIFFFNLFFVYLLPLNLIVISILIFMFLFILIYFSSYMYSYSNIFIFFSFSSLLNLILLLFQWCITICIIII